MRRLAVVFAGTLLAFQALALVGAQSASAAVTACSFSGGSLTIGITASTGTYFTQDPAGNILVGGVKTDTIAGCNLSVAATTANTTAINVNGPAGLSNTDEAAEIDMVDSGGSSGIDWGAINWTINLGANGPDGDSFTVYNETSDTSIETDWGASGVDLNGDGDLDVVLSGVELFGDFNNASTEDQVVNAGGTTATGAAFPFAFGNTLDCSAQGVLGITCGISGGNGDDTLTGGTGNDFIDSAGTGDDVLAGGLGDDTLDGDGDEDAVDYSASATAVNVNLTTGIATGEGLDSLLGIEDIIGSAQGDTLTGSSGDNWITPGPGDDTIDGKDGEDTLDYSDATAAVTVDMAAGTETGGSGSDTFSHMEDAVGSDFDDSFADNQSDDNVYDGGGGNDLFTQGAANGTDEDSIDGNKGVDTVDYSLRTEDLFVSLTGASSGGTNEDDEILNVENAMLGSGDDEFFGSGFNNTVFPGGGTNVLNGSGGIDTLNYSVGYTTGVTVNMTGGGVSGGGAADSATAFENAIGTDFNDVLLGSDVTFGTNGANLLRGGKGNDLLSGNAGPDFLVGGPGNDSVRGGSGDDTMKGSKGNDNLRGGSGDDDIFGGPGKDTCNGGGGADHIVGCEKHSGLRLASVAHAARALAVKP